MWELDYKKKLNVEELMLLNCCLEKTLESPLDCKEIQPKGNYSWIFTGRTDDCSWNSNTLVTWCKELIPWKRPWCWARLKAGGERDHKRWEGWMVSPIWCTGVWESSDSWWSTGKPGVLQSMGHKESDMTEWPNWADNHSLTWKGVFCLFLELNNIV